MAISIGLFIGLAIGTTGVGGGVLTAPLLILLLGVPLAESVGTALVFTAIAKINSAAIYLYRRQVSFRALLYLLSGGVPGAVIGSLLLARLRHYPKGPILAVVGATVALSAGLGIWRSWAGSLPRVTRLKLLPLFSLLIGLEVGFSSAGAGALGTVLLFSFTALAPAVVVGTDIVFGMVVSAVGGVLHVAAGNWGRLILLKLLAGGVVGTSAGSYLTSMFPVPFLRTIVLLWAVLLGLLLLFRGLETA